MDHTRSFRTKTGFCHLLPDRIVLTRDGVVDQATTLNEDDPIRQIQFRYGVLSAVLLYLAVDSYSKELLVPAVLFGLLALVLLINIATSLSNSATPLIHRRSIRKVIFKKGIPSLTRSRFEVLFENEKGQLKKRLILLPGVFRGGDTESEKAVRIMTEERLLKV